MVGVSLLSRRFNELKEQLSAVEATKRNHYSAGGLYSPPSTIENVDSNALLNWKVKAKSLLAQACGSTSIHYNTFLAVEKSAYSGSLNRLKAFESVFLAAQEDFEGGYLRSVRSLVEAEVFSSELDQARELLSAGYKSPAAVVAGVVLETHLRKLCEDKSIAIGKLDKMNADLCKAGVYNLLTQKRITAIADIRNNAAHGHPDKFNETDVSDMIAFVENFIADQLS